MVRIAMCAALLVLSAPAAAQVFKCVKGKETVYQGHPCGTMTDTARFQPPSAADVQRVQQTIEATSRRDAELRGGYIGASAQGASVPSTIGRCEAAKRQRDAELASYGSAGRNIEVRRAADRRVQQACN